MLVCLNASVSTSTIRKVTNHCDDVKSFEPMMRPISRLCDFTKIGLNGTPQGKTIFEVLSTLEKIDARAFF